MASGRRSRVSFMYMFVMCVCEVHPMLIDCNDESTMAGGWDQCCKLSSQKT